MTGVRIPLLLAAIGCLAVGITASPGQDASTRLVLLNVGKGQLPADTGMDDKTTPVIVDDVKELGGKALKVPFAAGDSFGGKVGANKNWKRFAAFRFDAFNPAQQQVNLELTVVHGRSTSYNTRVVMPIRLKPGKNEVKIGIDEMTNVNGSAPDLANVVRWFIGDVDKKAPTLLFGDIYLEGGEPPPGVSAAGASALIGYRIKGKIGQMDVDLTVTPFAVSGPAAFKPQGDPARLARLRAAKMPAIDQPTLFHTPEADAILSALEVFPPDNPWNLVVEDWPQHPNSREIVAAIGTDKFFRANSDMGFVLVPPNQPKMEVKIVSYPGESDKGPFPVPDNVPIEGWPLGYKGQSLDEVQRKDERGDRHGLVLDPANRMLYEFYQLRKTDAGWQAAQSSVFDLKSNRLRPDGWTSSDAAGLPIFPAVVRYDELKRGEIEHALRVTVPRSRREYVYPATHQAGHGTDANLPRMGERLRLRRDFDISGFTPEVQVILKALKKYGMFVADNGIAWAVSVAPDPRIPTLHEELRKIKGADFEVIQPGPGYVPPSSE